MRSMIGPGLENIEKSLWRMQIWYHWPERGHWHNCGGSKESEYPHTKGHCLGSEYI